MSHRIRFEVLPGPAGGWNITRDSVVVDWRQNKDAAIADGVERARAVLHTGGRAQLLIKGQDGRIQDERTYGDDPHPPMG